MFEDGRLSKFRMAAAKIVCRQSGSALARHCSREQTRGHGSVVDHADSLLLAIRQNLGFNLPADDGVGWLQRSDRGNFFGALDLRCTEIRNADPANLAFSFQCGESLPGFVDAGFALLRVPVHLIEIDGLYFRPAETLNRK